MRDATSFTRVIDGVHLTVIVTRKPVKHINARLRGTTLVVSAPLTLSSAELNRAITDLARRLIRRLHAHDLNQTTDVLALAKHVAARFPQPPTVEHVQFVTTQETCWGSYSSRTRTIRLHAALQRMPRWVLEAVIAHELAHTVHLDHSLAFWALLRQVEPHTERARGFLDGVSWLGNVWHELPPVERSLLIAEGAEDSPGDEPTTSE